MARLAFKGFVSAKPFDEIKEELNRSRKFKQVGAKSRQQRKETERDRRRNSKPKPTVEAGANLESVSSSSFEPQGVFSFQQLPPEIRNRIYELIFVKPTYIGESDRKTSLECLANHNKKYRICVCFYLDVIRWRNLNFAFTCRMVYNESTDIFFAKNGFAFSARRPALDFLMAIGHRRRATITKLRYNHPSFEEGFFDVGRYIKSCTGLRELHVSTIYVFLYQAGGRRSRIFRWNIPVKDPIYFFLGNSGKLYLGRPRVLNRCTMGADVSQFESTTVSSYLVGFKKDVLLVNREELGEYKPLVHTAKVDVLRGRLISIGSALQTSLLTRFTFGDQGIWSLQ